MINWITYEAFIWCRVTSNTKRFKMWFLSSLGNDNVRSRKQLAIAWQLPPTWNEVLVMTDQLTCIAPLRRSYSISGQDNHDKLTKGWSYRHNKKFSSVALNPIAAPYLERLLKCVATIFMKGSNQQSKRFFARYQDTSIKGC